MKIPSECLKFAQKVRLWKNALKGIQLDQTTQIGKNVTLERGMRNRQHGHLHLSEGVQIGNGCQLEAWGGVIEIGPNTFLGPQCILYGHGGITIGQDCLIAGHTCIASANHTIPKAGTPIRSQPDQFLPVSIGNDVWIGFGAQILGGVTIGDGCVVGAGAVVTGDLPSGSISVGNPAQVIRYRDKS